MPAYKGYAAFSHNKGRFWNIKTKNPPPLEDFYNDRDDQKTKEEKKLWWIEKSREKFYDMNAEILAYCVLDYFLNGCKVHGCFKRNKEGKLRPCRLMGYGSQLNDRNMFNETYSSVISHFESMKKRVLSTCLDEVSNIVVMQECEFYSEMRKVGSPIHKFFNDKSNPLSIKSKKPKLLCPRKSLRGGSVQHFQLLADSSEGEIFFRFERLIPFYNVY